MATRDSGRVERQRARLDRYQPHNPLEAHRPEGWRCARPPVPCMDWPPTTDARVAAQERLGGEP
jgi:hypothetical protein